MFTLQKYQINMTLEQAANTNMKTNNNNKLTHMTDSY